MRPREADLQKQIAAYCSFFTNLKATNSSHYDRYLKRIEYAQFTIDCTASKKRLDLAYGLSAFEQNPSKCADIS